MKHYTFIRHKVREYSDWRIEFDASLQWRRENGEKNYQIFRDEKDNNIVSILSEWKDLDSAKKFISNPILSEIMQIGGVMEEPTLDLFFKE